MKDVMLKCITIFHVCKINSVHKKVSWYTFGILKSRSLYIYTHIHIWQSGRKNSVTWNDKNYVLLHVDIWPINDWHAIIERSQVMMHTGT